MGLFKYLSNGGLRMEGIYTIEDRCCDCDTDHTELHCASCNGITYAACECTIYCQYCGSKFD